MPTEEDLVTALAAHPDLLVTFLEVTTDYAPNLTVDMAAPLPR